MLLASMPFEASHIAGHKCGPTASTALVLSQRALVVRLVHCLRLIYAQLFALPCPPPPAGAMPVWQICLASVMPVGSPSFHPHTWHAPTTTSSLWCPMMKSHP